MSQPQNTPEIFEQNNAMIRTSSARFELAAMGPAGVHLICTASGSLDGHITALVQGIEVGRKYCTGSLSVGDFLVIQITYFPIVNLPTEIRIAMEDIDLTAPVSIQSAEDVFSIVGIGDVRVENLRLEGGLLRGRLTNTTNGVPISNVYVKINSYFVRPVVIDPPRARVEGGSISLFAVPIRLSDFAESGLNVDLYVAGIEYPLANFSYSRTDPSVGTNRLVGMEEKLRQLENSTAIQVAMLNDSIDRRLNIQQERIDLFIEYALSIIINNTSDQSGSTEPLRFIEELLRSKVLNAEQARAHSLVATAAPSAVVPLDSTGFAFGWYDLEENEFGNFRWMGRTGLIRNPAFGRPITKIQLIASQVYGAHEPMVQALLDDRLLQTTVESQADGTFVLNFTLPATFGVAFGNSLRLESFATGCPASDHGTTDQRILSVAVTEVKFFYDTQTVANR